MTDRLDGVTTFVQVVESGSFALAAERLDMTRSAVGKAIARLEQRLGARLLQRTTRSQSLTDDGQAYYDAACARCRNSKRRKPISIAAATKRAASCG
jgi:DNA-binding transcriptional LysR family regulator